MEYLHIWLLLLCLAGAGAAVCLAFQSRKLYRKIDRMLDAVLDKEEILQSDLEEGPASALSVKAKRIQDVLTQEIRQAQQEKEQVKQLISNMSHQLKTPLSNVMMYQEMLKGPELTKEQRETFLEKMACQSSKIDWILNSLFKMARLEQHVMDFQVSALPLQDTLMDAVASVHEKAREKQIRMELKSRENPTLLHNRKWTEEAFVNLLENAIKYTEPGGCIAIEITPFELYTEIAFCDTGIGIAPSEYQAIFRRFYRGTNAAQAEGSGIGLYLTRLILEKEKGSITVSPNGEKGSRFSVLLSNALN